MRRTYRRVYTVVVLVNPKPLQLFVHSYLSYVTLLFIIKLFRLDLRNFIQVWSATLIGMEAHRVGIPIQSEQLLGKKHLLLLLHIIMCTQLFSCLLLCCNFFMFFPLARVKCNNVEHTIDSRNYWVDIMNRLVKWMYCTCFTIRLYRGSKPCVHFCKTKYVLRCCFEKKVYT